VIKDGVNRDQNSVRNYKQIYEQAKCNKVKNEFKDLKLKQRVKADDQYLVNLKEMVNHDSISISKNYDKSVVINRVANADARGHKEMMDSDLAYMWQ
jgi:hypothetical protein